MSGDDCEQHLSPPMLKCPRCGVPLVAPHGLGRYDADGNYMEHRDGCRCRWCGWMWFDDAEPVRCECGALVSVECSDQYAYAVEVEP